VAPLVLVIGAFLLWRVPGNVVPRFIVMFGVFGVAGQFDIDLNTSSAPALPAVLFIIIGAGLVAPSLGYLMMHFPTGRVYPSQFAPWLKWIAGVKFAGVILEVLATPGDIKVFRIGVNPLFVPSLGPYQTLIAASVGITGALLPLILIGGMLSLLLRFRASPPAERAQIQWVVGGFAGLVAAMLAGVVFVFSQGPGSAAAVGVILLASAALLWFVVSVAVAITRHRLYGIEQVVNRTLVYGALTACVAGLYVIVVGSVSTLLQTGNNLVISLLATGFIAVMFQPLRVRLQRSVNRLLYGERDEPYIVLSRLGERLEDTLPPDAMLRAIVESVATALKLPYVAIELTDGGVGQMSGELDGTRTLSPALAAAYGQSVGKTVSIPLNFQGETMGALLLAPRVGEDRFDDADLRLLNDLARQVGVAAHAVRLSADLQRSRERIVTAREEERRRIRRDLHDGLGPALAALTLKLDAARNLADRDTAATKTLLAELRGQTQAAITDIRRLVYDLRPPALDELGLVPAMREYATRLTSDGLQITLEADALPPLSAAAEVATYRIVTEALTNVVHHAHARHAQVRLSCAGMLHIEVTDDGAGLPPNVRAGVGLTSMRERAEELGGVCTVESPEGGTRVMARLPLYVKG
jgi:signal transduction histidine kinase